MKKIVIIGGGIAGLTAGIFAQKNGFESIILEKHHTLGGECTGWDRDGYHLDGCIHWLIGTREGTAIHELWKTVGALGEGVKIHHPESFLTYEHDDGQQVHLYRDLDRLKSSWLELAPEDEEAIEELCSTIKKLHSFDIPVGKPTDMMNFLEKIKLMLSMKEAGAVLQKYGKTSLTDYARIFKHPALRGALASFLSEGYAAAMVFFALASFTRGQASLPGGGSRALALRMQKRYLDLGGQVETNCEAREFILEKDEVRAVNCRNGKSFAGDYFIAALDAHHFHEKLLQGKYPDPKFQKRFINPEVYPVPSELRVALGYEGTAPDLPRTLRFPVKKPLIINGEKIDRLQLTSYAYEPDFAPPGHTLLGISINQFNSDYDAWDELYKDREAYQQEKERIGQDILQAVADRFPEMAGQLKVLDVASPKSFERYCNSYRGGIVAFAPTIKSKALDHSGRVPGLRNIQLSGQWLQGTGGLPPALITGKASVMRICKKERKQFAQ